MKKLFVFMLFGLVVVTETRAADYVCSKDGDTHTTLTIKHFPIDQQITSLNSGVQAILNAPAGKLVMVGKYDGGLNAYDLKDMDGNKVDLEVTSVFSHGGRCGRCTPEVKLSYYAKLITAQEETDFTCFLK